MIVTLFLLLPVHSVFASSHGSLQERIEQTEPGETLILPAGKYDGNVVIDKPMKVIGNENVQIIVKNEENGINLHTDNISIENVEIIDTRTNPELATITITSNNNELREISLKTNGIGIKLLEAHRNLLSQITINGNEQVKFSNRGNGIDLWGAHENVIESSSIHHVRDGIYLESSKKNNIKNNNISNGRYGYHLMFTENTNLEKNAASNNVSGIMVMGTEGTTVTKNVTTDNTMSVQSQGLLLYDVVGATVTDNIITENKIGLYIEESCGNEIKRNHINKNYIGVQFLASESNDFQENALVANVVQGQAENSSNNHTDSNYWGDHSGIDIDGDGKSNVTYTVDPYYISLTNEYPPFQLFFQAPGMDFLEQLLHTPTENWLVDKSPLMNNPVTLKNQTQQLSGAVLTISILFIITSSSIIFLGRKKQ